MVLQSTDNLRQWVPSVLTNSCHVPKSKEEAQQRFDIFSEEQDSLENVACFGCSSCSPLPRPSICTLSCSSFHNHPVQNAFDCSNSQKCIFRLLCALAQSRLLQWQLLLPHLMLCTRSASQSRSIGRNIPELIRQLSYPSALV